MKIVVFGSGNVATHLARALDRYCDVVQVVSRDHSHAARLASTLRNATAETDPAAVVTDADIYLVSVNDDSIASVAESTPDTGLWLHTSGSIGIDALSACKSRCGVLYPLQTFSREVEVDLTQVPIFVEGCDEVTTLDIERFAGMLSPKVFRAGSAERKELHIAAVFACNFVNHLWAIADRRLSQTGFAFGMLEPLVRATLDKALSAPPEQGQTGPASRGDRRVIADHLSRMSGMEADIYRLLSDSIMNDRGHLNQKVEPDEKID